MNTPDHPRFVFPQWEWAGRPPSPTDIEICHAVAWEHDETRKMWVGWHDDGSVYLADAGVLLHLPAPAGSILTDISARRCVLARANLGDDYRVSWPGGGRLDEI